MPPISTKALLTLPTRPLLPMALSTALSDENVLTSVTSSTVARTGTSGGYSLGVQRLPLAISLGHGTSST